MYNRELLVTINLSDTDFRILVSCVVLFALLLVQIPRLRRFQTYAYGFAGLVGLVAFFNFGLQFHQYSLGFVNRWELYHYQLGSKFFPELGYDGLYAASLVAQRETAPELPEARLRDLDSNLMVSVAEHEPMLREVRARFSEERWQSFVLDHHQYIEHTPPGFWQGIRRDHGYNPTPAWTFVARLFDAKIGSSVSELRFLCSFDILAMVAMFVVVFRTYGYRATCLALAIAGLGFGWRYLYIGSLLRLDWLVTTVIGICMLKRERFALAGAFLGYAAAVRVFPVLFLLGPGLLAFKAWSVGERPRWPLELAAGFVAVACVMGIGGSMTGRGFGAWEEFAQDIQVHRESWGTNQVGLDTLFVAGPSYVVANLSAPTGRRTRNEVKEILSEHRVGRAVAAGALLALLGLAVWRAPLADSAVMSLVAIFALTPAASYYWIMLLVMPLRRGNWPPLAVLGLAIAMYAIARSFLSPDYQPWLYAVFAWGNALLFLAWLLPEALRTLRPVAR